MPESLPTAPPRSPVAPDVDVSGRALHLRDVDIGAFLHPKTIALIGASDQSAKPNTAMTRKFAQWSQQNGATFYPVHPERASVLGHACFKSVFDIPGDIDLAIILTGKAVDTFEEVLARALSASPNDRFESADELLTELSYLLDASRAIASPSAPTSDDDAPAPGHARRPAKYSNRCALWLS